MFHEAKLRRGKARWDFLRWKREVGAFLIDTIGVSNPSDKAVATTVLLLKPVFGGTYSKVPHLEMMKALSMDDVVMYKQTFDSNNKVNRRMFFNDPFIRSIWSFLINFDQTPVQ